MLMIQCMFYGILGVLLTSAGVSILTKPWYFIGIIITVIMINILTLLGNEE